VLDMSKDIVHLGKRYYCCGSGGHGSTKGAYFYDVYSRLENDGPSSEYIYICKETGEMLKQYHFHFSGTEGILIKYYDDV
jgi:hypothetical protein